jgi:hypothetical protein
MEAFDSIEQARAAKRRRDFPEAERILKDALGAAIASDAREEALRQLFYLYFSPAYEDLEQAQVCLAELDRLNPSAHNGMEWTLFLMNCKQDLIGAKEWAEITKGRAKSEDATPVLYTATAFAGLLAAKESNVQNVQSALQELNSMIDSGQELPWGDEVAFLETSISLGEEIRRDVRALAAQVATKIEDPEYRKRAERLTHVD